MADEYISDDMRIQVTLDEELKFKATIHTSSLPEHLLGSFGLPFVTGSHWVLLVEEGMFEDRPEKVEGNQTVGIASPKPPPTCIDYNFSCGLGRELIYNASDYRCNDYYGCTEEDDNMTCCQIVTTTTLTTTSSTSTTTTHCDLNDTNSNCSTNETLAEEEGRRLDEDEELEYWDDGTWGVRFPKTKVRRIFWYEVMASPLLNIPIHVCETRYQDLGHRHARIYVPLEVHTQNDGRLRPKSFEVSVPTTAVKDKLGNLPQHSYMPTFTHDMEAAVLEPSQCYPSDGDNATIQESVVLRFSEPVKAGKGFFELWDVEDTGGPKFRIDVERLAARDDFPGRELVYGSFVNLNPQWLCEPGYIQWSSFGPTTSRCGDLEHGVTYFLATSEPGVLYDLMDNPLPKLDTNQTWRFSVDANVTRPPEVMYTTDHYSTTETPNGTALVGYVHFTQKVHQRGDVTGFPRLPGDYSEIVVLSCGADFSCKNPQELQNSSVEVFTASRTRGLEYGIAQFQFLFDGLPPNRFQVTVLRGSFLGADGDQGMMSGPSADYTFYFDMGKDPHAPIDHLRPYTLEGGLTPALGQTYVLANTDIVLYFNTEIHSGEGNLSFCLNADVQLTDEVTCILGNFADGSPAKLDIADAVIDRRKVTFSPLQDLGFGQMLYVLMPAGLVRDAKTGIPSGAFGGLGWSFSVVEGDAQPPEAYYVEGTDVRYGVVSSSVKKCSLQERSATWDWCPCWNPVSWSTEKPQ